MTLTDFLTWLLNLLAAWQETAVCQFVVWLYCETYDFLRIWWWQVPVLAGIGYLCAMLTAVCWWCWRE